MTDTGEYSQHTVNRRFTFTQSLIKGPSFPMHYPLFCDIGGSLISDKDKQVFSSGNKSVSPLSLIRSKTQNVAQHRGKYQFRIINPQLSKGKKTHSQCS